MHDGRSHDAALAELVTELAGVEIPFPFWDPVQKAVQELVDAKEVTHGAHNVAGMDHPLDVLPPETSQ